MGSEKNSARNIKEKNSNKNKVGHLDDSKRSDIGFDAAIDIKSKGIKGQDDEKRFHDEKYATNLVEGKGFTLDEVVKDIKEQQDEG